MKNSLRILKTRFCFFFFFLLIELTISIVGYSQIDQLSNWTWVGGNNLNTNSYGVYGTQGVSDPANKPGDRWSSVSWVDDNGNLWLFGGVGFTTSGSAIFLDDLWKYNINTNQWTWVKGGQTTYQPAVYGNKGEANNANTPGGRRQAVGWKSADGNLWLFGGYSISSSGCCFEDNNDLWKYDINSNQWTWMSGDNIPDQNGVYGIKGVSDPGNKPGARVSSNTITDQEGNFWLFGGAGFAASAEGGLNDLWKYNIATNEWTWMSGDNGINQFGNYGNQGIPASTNKPGSRYSSLSWLGPDGNIWIYGGNGYGGGFPGQQGDLNDLWKYNIATDQWTFMKGTGGANQVSVYGTKGIPGTDNRPGGREQAVGWTDIYGNLWLMGGNGLASEFGNYLNDLWKYNIATNQWTWVKGDQTRNQSGIYGSMGVADPSNKPGGRRNAISWNDNNGNFWLFGGDGYVSNGFDNLLNDLWKLSPSNTILSCPANVTITPPVDLCYAVVNNIDPILSPSGSSPTIVYSLTGATIATGTGTASGRTFNVGITTVTYSLPDNPSKSCSFTVTVTDNQVPSITCPSNISVNATAGICGMEVNYPAVVASDCAIDLATNFSGDRAQAGNMFNIVASNTVTIKSFDARIFPVFQNLSDIFIYYKVGTHVGFENNASAWTLIGSASNVLSNGDNVPTPVPVPINITIPAGQTYAFYITITNGNFLRYSFNLGTVNVSDGNIQIMTGTGNVYPFGSFSRNRAWNGIVHYNLDATVIQTAGLPSGSEFPVGTTTNTFVATDASGNTATCSFTVTVNYPVTPEMTISTSGVTNNFCNGILLTANSNVPVQSYSWSNGVTTQTNFLTTANTSGTYTVNAVSASGCPVIPSADFIYDKQAVISSYTLLATSSVKLQSNNIVKNGSVGVMNTGGTVSMKKNVNIEGAGAFLKADNISTYLPPTILQVSDPVTGVTLPDMPMHTSPTNLDPNAIVPNSTTTTIDGNRKNVTIGTNCNVTMTGSIYGNITIGSGSKVLFTQSYINVTAITMNAGTVSAYTQLKFSSDAIVRCAGSILVNTRCDVNPDNYKLVMYLGKTNNAPVAFTVAAGGKVIVNASMYIPSGKISVGGDAINITNMNGKFIAENIETLDKNVVWNWYDCTPAAPAPLITSKTNNAYKEQPTKPIIGLNVKAWPNPSEQQFTLNVESNSSEVVSINVYDMYGRIVYSTTGTANKQYQFGNRFVSGVYIAEVRQGVNRSTVKLIKQ